MRSLVVALSLLTISAHAQGAEVSLEFEDYRAPGQSRYQRSGHYARLFRTGRLSVARIWGGRLVTPIGSIPGNTGRMVLLDHGSRSASVLQLRNRDVTGNVEPLPDGGLLVMAKNDEEGNRAQAMVARYDAEGRELWRREVQHHAVRGCNDRETICGFIHLHDAVVGGSTVWVTGVYKRGEIEIGGTRIRGRRYMNGLITSLDLETGNVLWTRSGRGGELNLSLRGGMLVHRDGRGERRWVQLLDAGTGRPTGRVPLENTNGLGIEQLVLHDEGYAAIVETHIAAEHRNVWHLVGWDERGRRRFRLPVHRASVVTSTGATILLTDPRAPSDRDVGVVSNGVLVRELDVQGREIDSTQFAGWWFLESLRPERRGRGHALTGILADGDRYVFAARDGRSRIPAGAPPGRERSPVRPTQDSPFGF